jgi:hypothetical protein
MKCELSAQIRSNSAGSAVTVNLLTNMTIAVPPLVFQSRP